MAVKEYTSSTSEKGEGVRAVDPGDIEKYVTTMNTQLMSGQGSGIILLNNLPYQTYADKNLLVDLGTLIWKKKFSLVTGIMSPAFWNRPSLEKMLEASKQYCLICHFVERHDSIADALKREVLGREEIDEYGNKALYCSLNLLWLYKLFPEIVYFNLERETEQSIDEAGRNYLAKFEMKRDLTAAQKTKIMEYLHSRAEHGVIKEKTNSKIACIYWSNK